MLIHDILSSEEAEKFIDKTRIEVIASSVTKRIQTLSEIAMTNKPK